MSAAPYMPLYVADYLADTTHLTQAESGAYLLLLMAMWRAGGSLPADDAKLARFCRCTRPQWNRIKETILAFFESENGAITLRNRYLRHIRQDVRREYNPAWVGLRVAVLERDGYACIYCGNQKGPFEADHIIPYSRGGEDSLDNLVCACRTCNRSKGSLLISEWVGA